LLQSKHLPADTYLPSIQESQVASVKQVLQSELQLTIHSSLVLIHVAHTDLLHKGHVPDVKNLPSTQLKHS